MQASYNTDTPKRAFVCGWPIEHSRSPTIHKYWLSEYSIDGDYEMRAVKHDDLPRFVDELRSGKYVGGNFTIPHKEGIIQYLDVLEPAARAIGAVNTVWRDGRLLVGGNTDWEGFASNLDQYATGWDDKHRQKQVVVIGAGGAARGVLYALIQRGFSSILLANRTVEKAVQLANVFGNTILPSSISNASDRLPQCDLLINTSSMGMNGGQGFPVELLRAVKSMPPKALVTDIVYTPLKTPLLLAAERAGLQTVDGFGMLLHQAVPGFEKWFGVRPRVSEKLRAIALADGDPS